MRRRPSRARPFAQAQQRFMKAARATPHRVGGGVRWRVFGAVIRLFKTACRGRSSLAADPLAANPALTPAAALLLESSLTRPFPQIRCSSSSQLPAKVLDCSARYARLQDRARRDQRSRASAGLKKCASPRRHMPDRRLANATVPQANAPLPLATQNGGKSPKEQCAGALSAQYAILPPCVSGVGFGCVRRVRLPL